MVEFIQLNNLFLFLVFFFPGFLSLKVYDLLVPNERRNFFNAFLDAVSYSVLNIGLLIPMLVPALYFGWYENVLVLVVAAFAVFVFFPIIWPIVYFKIANSKLFSWFPSPIKRPWDWVFSRQEPVWVIVSLTDGRKIGGIFAENSYASSYPASEQIYLEQAWKLDENGKFKEPTERTKGVIILGKDILTIELFESE